MTRVVVIGSGFGGLGAAVRLLQGGVDEVTILERADSVGGTWRDNAYPDAACDIPAHLYSFSFAPKADWSHVYARQAEIRAYLERVTDDFDLRRRIRFGAEVAEARFDEATGTWTVTTTDGAAFRGDAVVAATGAQSTPAVPRIAGVADFVGAQAHSARWPRGLDVAGLRVGVVGTGASAVQIVPWLADHAGRVTVFQRSAPWVIPRLDRSFSRLERTAFATVPWLRRLYRTLLFWQREAHFGGFRTGSRGMRLRQAYALRYLRRAIADPDLRARLTPSYAMGCKRILLSSDYYPALARDHVELVTAPIERVSPSGIVTGDGCGHELDVIVWATGFAVGAALWRMRVVGREGLELREVWGTQPSAYLGTTVPGFPNFFVVLGPNTGLAHNSMIHVMESQYRYIVDAVRRLDDPRVRWLDVKPEALARFRRDVAERSRSLVWTSGCRSWYLTRDGSNVALWPGHTFTYRRRTRVLDPLDYHIEAVT